MLGIGQADRLAPKCYFAHTVLPTYIDSKQPPTKRKPFSTVSAQPCSHTLDVIIPAEKQAAFLEKAADSRTLQYARVHMKLADLLSGDFFGEYIKCGNILMLSEGRAGIDNSFSLQEGVLRLELDKPTYERVGLVGQPIQDHGRKHVKSRYAISLNLRLPSMVRGRKGFDRIVWAFENVLTQSLAWLFYDFRRSSLDTGPLSAHQPLIKTVEPDNRSVTDVLVPPFPAAISENEDQEALELLEWMRLVSLSSPRVRAGDAPEPVLYRYGIPQFSDTTANDGAEQDTSKNLVRLRWHGLIPAQFASGVLSAAVQTTGDEWCAMTAQAFDGKSYTILKNGGNAMTWECE